MSDEPINFPYRLRPEFLSAPEAAFYHVLCNIIHDDFFISPKVALSDLFFVARPNENVQYSNKLLRKNVDFLLLDRATLTPALAIELDHPKQVDHGLAGSFLDGVFAAAGLPLLHVAVQQTYDVIGLTLNIKAVLTRASGANLTAHSDYSPICPRCGITMVLRFDKDGPHRGQKYYGCLNFPECQEVLALNI
jgi:hypothetical protein